MGDEALEVRSQEEIARDSVAGARSELVNIEVPGNGIAQAGKRMAEKLGKAEHPVDSMVPGPVFRLIDVDLLRPSTTNPRKTFERDGLKELAESLKHDGGMIEPLVVRQEGFGKGRYEIVAGERRYRAAKMAGMESVPCIVRELSDDQGLEIQITENLQREDLSPIEEGTGYRTLMDRSGLDAEAIGKKIGKSRRYVYNRMKLVTLIPGVAKLVTEGKLSASHGELIGRLSADDQAELLKVHLHEDWEGRYPSIRSLAEVIQHDYYRMLNSVSFPKADALLLPAAGACTVCLKNTGFNQDLESSKKGAICTDGACYKAKSNAYVEQLMADMAPGALKLSTEYERGGGDSKMLSQDRWKECKSGDCAFGKEGIIVKGQHMGEKVVACAERTCKKHHARSGPDYAAQEAAERRKVEIEKAARKTLWLKLWDAPRLAIQEDLARIGPFVIRQLGDRGRRAFCQTLGIVAKKGQYGGPDYEGAMLAKFKETPVGEQTRFVVQAVLATDLVVDPYQLREAPRLEAAGTAAKVDLKKIRELTAAEAKDKELAKKRKSNGKADLKATAKTEVGKPKLSAPKAVKVQTAARVSKPVKKVLDKKSKKR